MIVNDLGTKMKSKVWFYLKNSFYYQRVKDSAIIQNINYNCDLGQKKVLLCYLPFGFFNNMENYNSGRNITYEIFKIVKVFSEFGYCIDIIGCNDLKSLEVVGSKRYNLIFGFGETFYEMTKLQPSAISVLYMTENHPDFSYQEEKKRIDYYYKRHKKHVPIERSGKFYKSKHMENKYNQIITLGEIEPLKNQYDNPYTIFPTGTINLKFVFKDKDHGSARKHFLWLGSNAVIHKGLDLLVDIFSQRADIYLHICGLDEKARNILKIPRRENILDYGFINIKSGTFLEIAETCSYSILPSCSEGCATSITTSMIHALIPVVMKNAGFNRLGDKALFLDDYNIEYLDNELSLLSNFNPAELNLIRKKVYEFAQNNFTISVFEENFREIIHKIFGIPSE